jgi:RHS repeat-associated protein
MEVHTAMTLSAARAYTLRFSRSGYTGKERDAESGNDYFGARYYASSMGRFMSPDFNDTDDDPEPVPYADLDDPQSLNLYGYVRNNPLRRTDSNGHIQCQCPPDPDWEAAQREFQKQLVFLFLAARMVMYNSQHPYSYWNKSSTPVQSTPSEQGRDAQGKFLPKQGGEAQPGADAEAAGLAAVGATKNTKPIPGSSRIPDGITPDGQYVEVKSGGSVSNTGQLEDMGKAAVAETGKPLIVVTTNPNVNVSGPAATNPNLTIRPLNQ